ncbi:MAG: SpoVR family protein [Myxococcales bacterium]|nr:SpoVR family protein [Myxococcota bacterium]MDW8281259.1 SpoVR family protein [Myxococcales bacterium]
MSRSTSLPPYLADMQKEIEEYARGYGLDFFTVIFEVLDYKTMNEVAAYGGFPTRYPHWRYGMEYEQLSKGHEYGLSKIYEMVINNDPCYAYLLEGNSTVDQKMVMAHVYAHCDFFKNNFYFSKTNRKMIDGMANHATRIRKHIERRGLEKVEAFIDTCLSLENLIDPHSPFIRRRENKPSLVDEDEERVDEVREVPRLPAKPYLDRYINPPEFLEKQRQKLEKEKERVRRFPEQPERDVLLFLIEHAPLERWERDVLEIIREEAYYFAPQAQTKIMNEGWATYWHSKIMTEKALRPSEIIDYADHASAVTATAPGQLNPYKLGVELFRHIEDRWNRGCFGKEWEECNDMAARKSWDRRLGLGRKKIFEVRQLYNDVTFIDEFFTEDFCREQRFYTYGFNERSGNWEIESREFKKVKEKLLFRLTNFGQPFIFVQDGNFENRGELLLWHRHEGIDLKLDDARDTLVNLCRVWKRPVNLLTKIDGKGKLLRYDGRDHSEKTADYPPP